ncbi:coiled-coil domain-containing protein 110 [Ranitomeya variabilis]|uniref:coiled-coil domain-containing protein 110 n=1 Tax=Ranitomeya variabilis TaxID=490064 RepID=UPI004057748C
MESSPSASTHLQMTSTPKCKAMDKLSPLHGIRDNTHIPFSITDKMSDPKKYDRLYTSCANKECDESQRTTTHKSPELPFMASKKHLASEMPLVPSSYTALPLKADRQPRSSLPYISHHIPESKDSLVSFEGEEHEQFSDQMLSISELKGKPSHAEEMEFRPLQITDVSLQLNDSSMSVTSDSRLTDHSVDLPKAEVPYVHQSKALLPTREKRIVEKSMDSSTRSTTNADNLSHVISITERQERAGSEEKGKINTLKNENCNLQKQFKNVDDGNVAKGDDFVFRIQELESYLTESDQLHMQEQRLKSKTEGVQMALKHLQNNEEFLKDENFRYREQIISLKTEKNFLELQLSRAELDGEEYVHEINTITDKCEELLNQRKLFQDERNHLSVEKQFLAKEIEHLNRENKRNAEQLALITAEKDKLVSMVNSMKTMVFTYTKEKKELQSRLKEVLVENTNLRKKISTLRTEQVKRKMDDSKEGWRNEETIDRHK